MKLQHILFIIFVVALFFIFTLSISVLVNKTLDESTQPYKK